jgi:hypothetical protein
VECPLLRMGRSDFCELMLCEVLLLELDLVVLSRARLVVEVVAVR